jgi:hypothetical protein
VLIKWRACVETPTVGVAALPRAIASAISVVSGKRMAVVTIPPNAKPRAGNLIGYMPNKKITGMKFSYSCTKVVFRNGKKV